MMNTLIKDIQVLIPLLLLQQGLLTLAFYFSGN